MIGQWEALEAESWGIDHTRGRHVDSQRRVANICDEADGVPSRNMAGNWGASPTHPAELQPKVLGHLARAVAQADLPQVVEAVEK